MQQGTITTVTYAGAEFAVGGMEFVEIEDKCEQIDKAFGIPDAEKDSAKEWITYHILFGSGHFISTPKGKEPNLSLAMRGVLDKTKAKAKSKGKKKKNETIENDTDAETEINEPSKVEVWSQSRIISERERLLKKEQALFKREQAEAIRQKKAAERGELKTKQENKTVEEAIKPKAAVSQFYHPDGTPYTKGQYFSSMLILMLIIMLFVLGFVFFVGAMIVK